MSACNQCFKVPCECMDDRAELLRSEFPGWSVDRSPTGFWMWRGNGPMPRTDERALVGAARLAGEWTGCTRLGSEHDFPDLLAAAEYATGEKRLSRSAKVETGTARVVSWADDIREQYEAAKAKHAAFYWSMVIDTATSVSIRTRYEGMKDLVFTKVGDRPWHGSTIGINVDATTLEDAFVAVMDACRRGDDNRPRPLAPSAEALRVKGAAEVFCAEWTRKLQAAYPTDGWESVVRQTVDKSHFYAADSGDSIIPLYVAPGVMRWYATKDNDYVGDAFESPLDALRAVDAVRPAAKRAAEVKERDFNRLTAMLERHTDDLRTAFPDREWSFSVGMDLAASCIHENEFGDVSSYIQWRDGWFAGTEDGPETVTFATPVEAFRSLTAGDVKRKDFATKPRHSLIPPYVLARHVLPVLHDGAQKHGADHWRRCSTRDYADAAMTHIQAFLDGADIDESGRHALAHAAADLLLGLGVLES